MRIHIFYKTNKEVISVVDCDEDQPVIPRMHETVVYEGQARTVAAIRYNIDKDLIEVELHAEANNYA